MHALLRAERWASTASAAAFLGGLNPIGAIFSSFFIQHITSGGAYLDKSLYCSQISDLISAIIIYLCGFVLLFLKTAMNNSACPPRGAAAAGSRVCTAAAETEAASDPEREAASRKHRPILKGGEAQ